MLARIGALEAKLTTLEDRQFMQWFKRKLHNFFNTPAEAELDLSIGMTLGMFGGMV